VNNAASYEITHNRKIGRNNFYIYLGKKNPLKLTITQDRKIFQEKASYFSNK